MRRIRRVSGLAFLLTACTPRDLPPSHALADDSPHSAGGESPLENDVVRRELREIHELCELRVDELAERVDDVAMREDIARVVAYAAYLIGEQADGAGDGEVMGRVGAGGRACADSPADVGCGSTGMPSVIAGAESPIRQDTIRAQGEASDRIRAINRALDGLDDFVFAQPDPATWSGEAEDRWQALGSDARVECTAPSAEEH